MTALTEQQRRAITVASFMVSAVLVLLIVGAVFFTASDPTPAEREAHQVAEERCEVDLVPHPVRPSEEQVANQREHGHIFDVGPRYVFEREDGQGYVLALQVMSGRQWGIGQEGQVELQESRPHTTAFCDGHLSVGTRWNGATGMLEASRG